jgi:hypothetical protein
MYVRLTVGPRSRRAKLALLGALLPSLLGMTQLRDSLPFSNGERLVYNAHAGPGMNARAVMWVDGPLAMNGAQVWVLNSQIKGGFGPVKVTDRTTSWIDPDRMAIVRFQKEERNPLSRHTEEIEVDPDGRTWRTADGRVGTSPSGQPLDELSFIYMLRALKLPADSAVVFNRHFDPDRNPTIVRSLGAGVVHTKAGTFATREIEMRVRDARRYKGEGVIRISLSDDVCRRPVRIESRVPNAGKIVMELLSAEPEIAGCLGR